MGGKRFAALVGALIIGLVVLAAPALADLWMEEWSHHDGYHPIYGSYHLHAYVGALAYDSLGHCYYKDWVHGKNDSSATSPMRIIFSSFHNNEYGWSKTSLFVNGYEDDWVYVELEDLLYCPF